MRLNADDRDKITITWNDKVMSGIFYDIDDNGYLLLKRKDSIEKIHFGDVSLSDAAYLDIVYKRQVSSIEDNHLKEFAVHHNSENLFIID